MLWKNMKELRKDQLLVIIKVMLLIKKEVMLLIKIGHLLTNSQLKHWSIKVLNLNKITIIKEDSNKALLTFSPVIPLKHLGCIKRIFKLHIKKQIIQMLQKYLEGKTFSNNKLTKSMKRPKSIVIIILIYLD